MRIRKDAIANKFSAEDVFMNAGNDTDSLKR